ncbi:MAG TPA: hypothetical protein VGP16_04585 [Asanoa sp.]|jgi:hypothetical protein|nr:hypothetical protein [Asanoa sp.]
MSLRDLDDAVRLAAVRRAATSGEVGLFDDLLDLALHDDSEVRTEGGLASAGPWPRRRRRHRRRSRIRLKLTDEPALGVE